MPTEYYSTGYGGIPAQPGVFLPWRNPVESAAASTPIQSETRGSVGGNASPLGRPIPTGLGVVVHTGDPVIDPKHLGGYRVVGAAASCIGIVERAEDRGQFFSHRPDRDRAGDLEVEHGHGVVVRRNVEVLQDDVDEARPGRAELGRKVLRDQRVDRRLRAVVVAVR